MDSDFPLVAILSIGQKSPKDLVAKILGCAELPVPVKLKDNNQGYRWKIDTKYYTAETYLCPLDFNNPLSSDFSDSVEALIIYYDSNDKSSLDKLNTLTNTISDCDADVTLLVCDTCSTEISGVSKNEAQRWCLSYKFELIELEPNESGVSPTDELIEDVADEIIPERKGIARVIEALEAHTWLNLNMKDRSNTFAPSISENSESLDKLLEDMFKEDGSFTNMFSQLNTMKESVQSLPFSARRAGAEQVVTAFWRAIGGDEDEIAGLTEL